MSDYTIINSNEILFNVVETFFFVFLFSVSQQHVPITIEMKIKAKKRKKKNQTGQLVQLQK